MLMASETSKKDQFNLEIHPQPEAFIKENVNFFLKNNSFADNL